MAPRSASAARSCARPRRLPASAADRTISREEFLSALEIIAHGDVDPAHLQGSWAGAFGPTQFMPTSFKKNAVDFDGDGRLATWSIRSRI